MAAWWLINSKLVLEIVHRTWLFSGHELNELHNVVIKSVQTAVEKWCFRKLSDNAIVYGIRRYTKGAWLSLHLDHLFSHVLSVILQVCTKGGTKPNFSKLNRARALTSPARAKLRAQILYVFRAQAELQAQVVRVKPRVIIFEPSLSRAFEPQKGIF